MYFRTAWRNILRTKGYSALNIAGLAIGMGVALIIGLWVEYQLSYDHFLPGIDRVSQLMIRSNENGQIGVTPGTPLPLSAVLRKEIPGIQYAAVTDWMGANTLAVGEKKYYDRGAMAESDFLRIFQYPLVEGAAESVLQDPYSIVLDESAVKALFGNVNPMGKMVRFNNEHDLKVTGIMKDPPRNATFPLHYVVPFSYVEATQGWVQWSKTNWNNNSFQTFIALLPNASAARVNAQLADVLKKYIPDSYRTVHVELIPKTFTHLHLYADYTNGIESGGLIQFVRIFALVGILVLLIACINFVNLTTARSEKRAREVGIRKTIGSDRLGLIIQFLVESLVITFLAAVLSLLLVSITLPAFNSLTQTEIRLPFANLAFWGIMAGYILVTGLLAGSRPAFYLSSFRPIKVLKGTIQTGKRASLPRKVLVVIQFTSSVALIISTLIIYRQVQYAKNRPKGYDYNRLVETDNNDDLGRNYPALKHDLIASGVVSDVAYASSPATNLWSSNSVTHWSGQLPGETLTLSLISTGDADYFKTLGMHIIAGRGFTAAKGVDSTNVILNEAAVKRMRFDNPIGQEIVWHDVPQRARVIGVVKDALIGNPYAAPDPTIFIFQPGFSNIIDYRLAPGVSTHDALAKIAPIFSKYSPAYPFQYSFVDTNYAEKSGLETLIGTLSGLFAVLAVFISCLGLFGLAAYTAERRTKEIGIRKVLGASVSSIWMLLSREFIALVAISCLFASGLSFYFLQGWLDQYYYHIHMGPDVFLLAAFAALTITLITISFQAIRAALMKPVNSLRTE